MSKPTKSQMEDLSPEQKALMQALIATIAGGKIKATTAEFGRAIRKAPQTIRKNLCLTGEAYGLRSIKVGNEHLFDVPEIALLLVRGIV